MSPADQYETQPKFPTFGPMPENPDKQIFSEGIDYLKKGKQSIWKDPNPLTSKKADGFFGSQIHLHRLGINGQTQPGILADLGGGDGRYKSILENFADRIIELDIDPSALLKIKRDTEVNEPISLVQANLVEPLPFKTGSVGGVFSAGILHLFSSDSFREIANEINRILEPNGGMFLEFRIDIKQNNS